MSINNNGVANVKSGWDSGDFVVLGNDNTTELIRADGVNNTITVRGVTVTSGGDADFADITADQLTLGVGGYVKARQNYFISPSGGGGIDKTYNATIILGSAIPAVTLSESFGQSELLFVPVDLVAFTVTLTAAPLSSINGWNGDPTKTVATFSGTYGAYLRVVQYGLIWYIVGSNGITLS